MVKRNTHAKLSAVDVQMQASLLLFEFLQLFKQQVEQDASFEH